MGASELRSALVGLGSAIRTKAGTTGSMTIPQMTNAVKSISVASLNDTVSFGTVVSRASVSRYYYSSSLYMPIVSSGQVAAIYGSINTGPLTYFQMWWGDAQNDDASDGPFANLSSKWFRLPKMSAMNVGPIKGTINEFYAPELVSMPIFIGTTLSMSVLALPKVTALGYRYSFIFNTLKTSLIYLPQVSMARGGQNHAINYSRSYSYYAGVKGIFMPKYHGTGTCLRLGCFNLDFAVFGISTNTFGYPMASGGFWTETFKCKSFYMGKIYAMGLPSSLNSSHMNSIETFYVPSSWYNSFVNHASWASYSERMVSYDPATLSSLVAPYGISWSIGDLS